MRSSIDNMLRTGWSVRCHLFPGVLGGLRSVMRALRAHHRRMPLRTLMERGRSRDLLGHILKRRNWGSQGHIVFRWFRGEIVCRHSLMSETRGTAHMSSSSWGNPKGRGVAHMSTTLCGDSKARSAAHVSSSSWGNPKGRGVRHVSGVFGA